MTVSTEVRRGGPYNGSGTTGPFSFTFKTFDVSTIVANQRVTATDANTVLTLTTDYTISLNADQDNNPGGSITLVNALPVGSTLTLTTNSPRVQGLDLTNPGGFYPKTITDQLDKTIILIQELWEQLARTAQFPIVDNIGFNQLPSALDRANKVLSFDADGIPEAVINVSDIAAAAAAATAAVAAATAAQAAADAAIAAAAQAEEAIPAPGFVGILSTVNIPNGWLLCDGSAVSRTTFADLFAEIGTTHGEGNGTTTFNVPDYRGRWLRMRDGTAGRDPDKLTRTAMGTNGNTGNALGSVQLDALQDHTHFYYSRGSEYATGGDKGALGVNGNTVLGDATPNGAIRLVNNTNPGPGGTARVAAETRTQNAYVDFIIKT